MAHPIASSRGQAMLEAIASMMIVMVVCTGILAVLYLGFARSWINVQGEQALLCASEGTRNCQSKLKSQLERFLPWGSVKKIMLNGSGETWALDFQWELGGVRLKFKRSLKFKEVAAKKVLPFLRL